MGQYSYKEAVIDELATASVKEYVTKISVQERNVCLCGNDLTAVGKRTALLYSWIFLVLHILTNSGSKCFTAVP